MSFELAVLLFLFLGFMIIGVPISYSTALSCGIYLLMINYSIIILPQRMFATTNNTAFIAIPLFMLAGELMNSGGITKKIVEFSKTLIGHITGGFAHVSILAGMIFAAMSGSAAAAGASIGSMMIPAMEEAGYDKDFGVAVTASAAVIGPVIPPSIIMVIFAGCTGASVGKLFLGGVIPGILIGIALMIISSFIAKKRGYKPMTDRRASVGEIVKSFWTSFPALLLPVIIIGGILSGIVTPTEAGMLGVIYGALIGFLYREISIKDIRPIFLRAAKSASNILFLMATGQILGWILTSVQLPQTIAAYLTSITSSSIAMMMIIIFFVSVLGCFMDNSSIVPILAPLLLPITQEMGIDLIQYGVILCTTAVAGALTPPVGNLLYIGASIGNVPVMKAAKTTFPFWVAITITIILCGIFPSLITFLPGLMG
jgi:C4-dicarboxylate transporter DctM subunit